MSYDAIERSDSSGSKIELYLFEWEGSSISYAYTTASRPVHILGHDFMPEAISRSENKAAGGEGQQERLTISVPFDNPVAIMHVPYLPPRPVRVTIYGYHRRDGVAQVVRGFIGSITNFAQRGEIAELACSQIIDSMQQTVPWAPHKRNCVWATYSEMCGVPRENFHTSVTVVSFAATTLQGTNLAAKPNGWFTAGYAENPATGEVRFITQHVGDTVKLVYPFTNLQPNDVLDFYAGDDHTPEMCNSKFGNKLNYLGFDKFPTFNPFVEGTYGGGGGGGGGSRYEGGGGGGGGNAGGSFWGSIIPRGPDEPPVTVQTNDV